MNNFLKTLAAFILVLVLIAAPPTIRYISVDPYCDFGKKENYSWKYVFQSLGDINTKKILSNGIKYNSFVFGSSRSTSVYACYLQEKIPNSIFFHFANWNESIGGIERKLLLLDTLGYKIQNAVVYIDNDNAFADDFFNRSEEHYMISGKDKYDYLANHYKSFFKHIDKDKLKILLGLPPSKTVFPNWVSDLHMNDPNHICGGSVISNYGHVDQSDSTLRMIDSLKKVGFFYDRPAAQTYSRDQISSEHKKSLENIRRVFKKHETKYFVVIVPLYDQKKFSLNDKKLLSSFFGKNLYDFSGINEMTKDIYNYPDRKHFQPYISKQILDSVLNQNGSLH